MPISKKTSDLDARIASIAQQMAAELVLAVREHLAEEVANVIGGQRNGAVPSGRAKRRRRGAGVDDTVLEQLLRTIKASPGLRSEEIYKKLPVSPKVAKAGLAKLREQKKVKTSGEKRATTYRAK